MAGHVSFAARYAPAFVSNGKSLLDEHRDIVKVAASPTLLNMSKSNRDMLKSFTPSMPDWLKAASQQQRTATGKLVEDGVAAHTLFTNAMLGVTPIHEFAEPILRRKISDEFGVDLDVNKTWVEPVFRDGLSSRTELFTLLEAALHNFEEQEADLRKSLIRVRFLAAGESYGVLRPFSLDGVRFIEMCRELDLGQQYQTHIKDVLEWENPEAQSRLKGVFSGYHKASLKAASHIALLKGDIDSKHHLALLEVISGKKGVKVDGKSLWCRSLSFMNMALSGCAIFEIADSDDDSVLDKLLPTVDGFSPNGFIAYIPDDPDHPVKFYPSLTAFKTRLISQFVRTSQSPASASQAPTDYQQFFSRFVKYEDRAKFFASFTEEIHQERGATKRRQKQAPDFLLQLRVLDPSGDPWNPDIDFWTTLFREFKKRLLLDARSAAVPTADADARGRRSLISQLFEIGLTTLNLVSFVVPAVGVAMLGVMAVQLMYEVVEGIEDLSLGDKESGWRHITGVLDNLAMTAGGAAILGAITSGPREGFVPIELDGGQKRLWKPDLSAYRSQLSLEGIEPNVRGQYRVANRVYVRIDGHVFEKRFDSVTGTWRIVHPQNARAYQPMLAERADGWDHTLQRPVRQPEIESVFGAQVEEQVIPGDVGTLDVAPEHPVSSPGIDNQVNGRYAVEESLILGLTPAKGIYRSVDGQWCYIRNVDDAGTVAVYRISDSFNLNADIVDVNIVDPESNRATEMRLWQVKPDQWQALSLKGGAKNRSLVTARDLLDWHRMSTEARQASPLRKFAVDRGLFLPTLQRYVLGDGSLTTEGLEFLQSENTPRLSVTAEHLSKWESLSARERHEWTREGFANRHSLDIAEFMGYVNQDGTLEPAAKGLLEGGAIRKRLSNGLWEPVIIGGDGRGNTKHLPFDWGDRHQVSYSIEPTSIHQALSRPELNRLTISAELMDPSKARYSPGLATRIAAKEGGGSFIFTMERMKYSGAVEGEFNAIKILDIEAGKFPDQSNAVSGYWAPQGGHVDIPVHPGWAEPDHVFTPGFGGCSLVVDQMDENLLRVRHVEGGKEAAQYNDLAVNEHGLGLSAAMEFPDYGLRLDENGNADSILTGFAFMKYDRTDRVWTLHYQSSQGAAIIIKYATEKPGWFASPNTLAQVYERPKVVKIEARPVVTIQRSANRHANEVASSTQSEI